MLLDNTREALVYAHWLELLAKWLDASSFFCKTNAKYYILNEG